MSPPFTWLPAPVHLHPALSCWLPRKMALAVPSPHWKHPTSCTRGWHLLFSILISHWLLTEILKMTVYTQIYFSFPKDGPDFTGEFPACPLHFALFACFNYFRLVSNHLFFFFFWWNSSLFLCCWCCLYYLHISIVYKIITKLLINEWSQDQFQGNPTTDCLQLNASSSSTAYFHSRTLA